MDCSVDVVRPVLATFKKTNHIIRHISVLVFVFVVNVKGKLVHTLAIMLTGDCVQLEWSNLFNWRLVQALFQIASFNAILELEQGPLYLNNGL